MNMKQRKSGLTEGMMRITVCATLVALLISLFWATQSMAMTFREEGNGGNCNGCDWFAADGEITQDTPKAFEQFVKDKNYKVIVYFNSPGGNLMAGIKLGELIRAKGLDTSIGATMPNGFGFTKIVQGRCTSACAYAFLGGVTRSAKANEIGVHQFYNEATLKSPSDKLFDSVDLSAEQLISALVIDYVFRMGVDPRVVSVASTTLPGEMHFFAVAELTELNVVWSAGSFDPWAIEPYGGGVVAYTKSKDKKETATLFCRRDKMLRLLITAPIFDNAVRLQEAITSLEDGLEVMDMKVPKESANVRIVNGLPALEIQLIGFDVRKIDASKDLAVHGDVPRVNAPYFYHPLNGENLAGSVRVAARNCL